MDFGEQCVVRDGGTQRLVWSVRDWDSQDEVIGGINLNYYVLLFYLLIQMPQFISLEKVQFSLYTT